MHEQAQVAALKRLSAGHHGAALGYFLCQQHGNGTAALSPPAPVNFDLARHIMALQQHQSAELLPAGVSTGRAMHPWALGPRHAGGVLSRPASTAPLVVVANSTGFAYRNGLVELDDCNASAIQLGK